MIKAPCKGKRLERKENPLQKGLTKEQRDKKLNGAFNRHLLFDNQVIEKWLSTKEAASYLGLSPNALRILVHRQRVRAYKLGARLKFRVRDLRSALQPKEVL